MLLDKNNNKNWTTFLSGNVHRSTNVVKMVCQLDLYEYEY